MTTYIIVNSQGMVFAGFKNIPSIATPDKPDLAALFRTAADGKPASAMIVSRDDAINLAANLLAVGIKTRFIEIEEIAIDPDKAEMERDVALGRGYKMLEGPN